MKIKKRLDQYIQEKFPQYSRNQVQSYIMQGKVLINGVVNTKPGTQVADDDEITTNIVEPKYVCRAGWKLEHALEQFNISVKDLTILDAGLSTGGFTDCMLQRGAKKIYGVDVGFGQVHEKIRTDTRVVVMEKTNLRYLESLPERIDLVTLDLSFISVLKVIEVVKKILKDNGKLIILIKPQFEALRHEVGKGGIVKDDVVHKRVTQDIIKEISAVGFINQGLIDSPIEGTSGNKEFLAYFIKAGE